MHPIRAVLLASGILLGSTLVAQSRERFLPVAVSVTTAGASASMFTVTLYKDNKQVTQLLPSKHGAFELDLELDSYYTIHISKEGYGEKLLAVDTDLPEGVEHYDAYQCVIELGSTDRSVGSDPFYLDFPCAVVRWDEAKQSYDHSDEYLADIQEKSAPAGTE